MFLNSDMSLLWDITPVGPNGEVTCDVLCKGIKPPTSNCCPSADQTQQKVHDYATDNQLWMDDLTNVFLKMIDINGGLVSPTA